MPTIHQRVRRVRLGFLLGGFLLLAAYLFAEPSAISLKVSPTVCHAPCTVRYSIVIHRHKENKRWSIAWGADTGHEGYDEREHIGKDAPFVVPQSKTGGTLPDLPQGFYEVQACVYRSPTWKRCSDAKIEVH